MPRPRTRGAPRPGSDGVAAKALPSESIAQANERSLRPRAARVDVDAAIRRVHRRFDLDALVPQVLLADRPSGLAHERGDLPRDLALVDRVTRRHDARGAPAFGVRALEGDQATEERAELLLHEDLAHVRRASARQENGGARRPLTQAVREPLDGRGEARVYGEAVAELDRRR